MALGPHRCCEEMRLDSVGDCGEVTGFDLTLQKCRSCGAYVMDFYWAGSNTPNVMTGFVPDLVKSYEAVRDAVAACLEDLERHEVFDPA
jgi:hypothetical protein